MVGWLAVFYGISNFVGYLMPSIVSIYIYIYFFIIQRVKARAIP